MRIIAFCGPKSAGKDTAAKYLLARASLIRADLFIQVNFADTLKNVCGLIFGLSEKEMNDPMLKEMPLDRWPFVSPRTLLQNVAKTFRTLYAPDVWVKAWSRKVDHIKAGCIVITDLRHMEEYEKLRELGARWSTSTILKWRRSGQLGSKLVILCGLMQVRPSPSSWPRTPT